MTADLRLAVKREYFEAIRDGLKPREYRLRNSYWEKRLIGRNYNNVIITLGYPKSTDTDKILTFPWTTPYIDNITHKHFGGVPQDVFVIILYPDPESK